MKTVWHKTNKVSPVWNGVLAEQWGSKQFFRRPCNGGEVYLSYNTTVAVRLGRVALVTTNKYSVTTTRQINSWIRDTSLTEIKVPDSIVALFARRLSDGQYITTDDLGREAAQWLATGPCTDHIEAAKAILNRIRGEAS